MGEDSADEPETYDVVNGEASSWQADEPFKVNGWQQISKLEATADGRGNRIALVGNPSSRRQLQFQSPYPPTHGGLNAGPITQLREVVQTTETFILRKLIVSLMRHGLMD